MGNFKTSDNTTNIGNNNLFTLITLCIFIIGVFTLDTFMSSYNTERILLGIAIILLLTSHLYLYKGLLIYKVDLMWSIFFMYFLINLAMHDKSYVMYTRDAMAFIIMILFIVFAKLNIRNFKIGIKLIALISIFYAFGTLFQYWNFDYYSSYILPRFSNTQAPHIISLYTGGAYTGFTWQTAFNAGYLVFGIGIFFLSYKYIENKFSRIITILVIALLFFTLFMTAKRAHLLFLVVSLIITLLITKENRNILRQLKVLNRIILGAILTVFILMSFTIEKNSQVSRMMDKITSTIEGVSTGEDITSGRIYLYDYAVNLFVNNPWFGVGWRAFGETSLGIVSSVKSSQPHNIYLQLLAELGIVGFVLFMTPVLYLLVKTIKTLFNYETINNTKFLLQYSLFIQLFFILYGLTGNLLTDRLFLYVYFFAVAIFSSVINSMMNEKEKLKD